MIKVTKTTDVDGNEIEIWEQTDEEKKRIADAWAETKSLENLDIQILEEITEIRPENKDWVLKALGFKRINTYTWEHPWFWVNKDKYIRFDIETDDLKVLIARIFEKGRDYAKEKMNNRLETLY